MTTIPTPRPHGSAVLDLAARRRTGKIRDGFAAMRARWTGDVDTTPDDRPGTDATLIAKAVEAGSEHPALRAGKGIRPEPANDWDAYIAPVLELCRPRKNRCVACGGPGPVRAIQAGGEIAHYCIEDAPRGILGVIDGGDIA